MEEFAIEKRMYEAKFVRGRGDDGCISNFRRPMDRMRGFEVGNAVWLIPMGGGRRRDTVVIRVGCFKAQWPQENFFESLGKCVPGHSFEQECKHVECGVFFACVLCARRE